MSEAPKTAAQYIGEGVGCLFSAIAIAIIAWALAGFPSIPS